MAFTPERLMAAVERSPVAAGAHDRAGWVALFTADATVEDPVGSRPHRNRAEIARFYDTFIATRDITFHRDVDIVAGSTVLRDLELEAVMATGLTLRIPAYLRYDLADADGEPAIAALQAFWELPAMIGQFLRGGLRAVPAGVALSTGLVRNQGPAGAVGFLTGLRGAGRSGKRRFAAFLDGACAGDEITVRRNLAKGAPITSGDADALGATQLLNHLRGARWQKLIASGRTMVVRVHGARGNAVLIAEMATNPFRIARIRYFTRGD